MKKKSLKILLCGILSTLLLTNCDRTYTYQNSVLFYENNFDFPIYSEQGYNTFGVMFDNQSLVSDNNVIPMKVLTKSNQISFVFTGKHYISKQNYNGSIKTLKFVINNLTIDKFEDLILMEGLHFPLNDSNCQVIYDNEPLKIDNGLFHIKKVGKIILDGENLCVYMSGEFYFDTYLDDFPTCFYEGRYDITVGKHNFYKVP